MRECNWPKYNKELVQRGSLTFLIDPKIFKTLCKPLKSKRRGRPVQYNLKLIEFLLMVKIHFKLAYRTLQGFADSFLKKWMPNEKAPDYTLVCKRVLSMGKLLPILRKERSHTVILDASGMKVVG